LQLNALWEIKDFSKNARWLLLPSLLELKFEQKQAENHFILQTLSLS